MTFRIIVPAGGLHRIRLRGSTDACRYTSPTGAVIEAGSFVSPNRCEDRELYSQRALLVIPDIPEVVCEEGRLRVGVLGGALPLAMLSILICQTTDEGRFTFWTWLAVAAAGSYMAVRFWKGLRTPC